jgi:hypothetical protein
VSKTYKIQNVENTTYGKTMLKTIGNFATLPQEKGFIDETW